MEEQLQEIKDALQELLNGNTDQIAESVLDIMSRMDSLEQAIGEIEAFRALVNDTRELLLNIIENGGGNGGTQPEEPVESENLLQFKLYLQQGRTPGYIITKFTEDELIAIGEEIGLNLNKSMTKIQEVMLIVQKLNG